MDIRPLTDAYAVSPQIDPSFCSQVAQAGYGTIICNRPDAENPPGLHAAEIEAAAQAAGLAFVYLPITHQSLNAENITKQAELISKADKPVFAYCASGTRSTILWALGQAGSMPADDLIAAADQAGYDLRGLRGALGG